MNKKQLFTAISLLTLSGTVSPASAAPDKQVASNPFQRCDALKGSKLDQADCACDVALSNGSAKTIQLFINKYSNEAASTACGALALTDFKKQPTDHGGQPNSYN